MTIQEVLDKLENATEDTCFSSKIFALEEGRQDDGLKKGRRDWLIIADIYNKGKKTQKFHLTNYLNFKLNDGLTPSDDFLNKCYRYIRNTALILYIAQEIFDIPEKNLERLFKKAEEHYKSNEEPNCPVLASELKHQLYLQREIEKAKQSIAIGKSHSVENFRKRDGLA